MFPGFIWLCQTNIMVISRRSAVINQNYSCPASFGDRIRLRTVAKHCTQTHHGGIIIFPGNKGEHSLDSWRAARGGTGGQGASKTGRSCCTDGLSQRGPAAINSWRHLANQKVKKLEEIENALIFKRVYIMDKFRGVRWL